MSRMYRVVNDEPPWIDWKMPHIIGGLDVRLGRQGPFSDPLLSDHTCPPPSKWNSDLKDSMLSEAQIEEVRILCPFIEFLQ